MGKRYWRVGDELLTQDLLHVKILERVAPAWFKVQYIGGTAVETIHGRHLHLDTPEIRAWLAALLDYEAYIAETSRLARAASQRVGVQREPGKEPLREALNQAYVKARNHNPYV